MFISQNRALNSHRSALAAAILLVFFGNVFGQPGECKPFDFNVTPSFQIGTNTTDYATGDFNSDGKADVAAANVDVRTLTVIMADGAGGFGPPASYASVIDPRGGIAAGDLNNDGHLDLVAASYNEKKFAIFLNNGSGTFLAPFIYVPPAPGFAEYYQLEIADFNLDGNNDIVAIKNQTGKQVSFFLGDGHGNLTQSSIIPVAGNESVMAIGHLNNDGIPDVVVSGGSPRGVYFIYGNQAGAFSLTFGFSLEDRPAGFGIVDVNNDTIKDLVIPLQDTTTPSSPSVRTWLGNGTGGFFPSQRIDLFSTPMSITMGDYNGDELQDIAMPLNGLMVVTFQGSANGTFQNPSNWNVLSGSNFIATANLDADNRPDILLGQFIGFGPSSVSVMKNDNGVGFKAIQPILYGGTDIVAADMNNDNFGDMVTVTDTDFNASSEVVIALNEAGNGLAADRNFATPRGLRAVVAGDLNNDGNQDIVTTHSGNDAKLAAYLGDGNGNVGASIGMAWPQGIESVVIGKFNSDSNLDLFIVDGSSRGYTLLGAGDGHFTPVSDFLIDQIDYYRPPVVGDFNGDAKLDLATFTGMSITTRIGVGDGRFTTGTTVSGPYPDSSATGDFDRDGNLDLVTLGSVAGNAAVTAFYGDGSGGFPTTDARAIGGQGAGLIAEDFNADGFTDVAFISGGNLGNLVIIPFGGQTPHSLQPIYMSVAGLTTPSGGFSSGLTAADYNHDDKIDIGYTNRYVSRGIIYNSAGRFPCIGIDDVQVTEGDSGSNATFTVQLSAASTEPVLVNYSVNAGTATIGDDITFISGRLQIPAGQTSATVNVPVVGDLYDEFDETFSVTLSSPANASLFKSVGNGLILDNDPEPTLTISDVSINEGFQAQAVFTVSLSAPSGKLIGFRAVSSDGTAVRDVDYFGLNWLTSIPVGGASTTFSVAIASDQIHEADEDFFVNLIESSNVTVADGQGRGVILDNDPIPTLSVFGSNVVEGDFGITNATVFFQLSNPTSMPVMVNLITSDGTAIGGVDYVSSDSQITIPAEQLTFSATLGVIGDAADERNETFSINVYNAINATIGAPQSQFSITDDDPTAFDFDRDGKTDISLFRPSNGTWYLQRSQAGFLGVQFGASDDKLAPADYDGDGRTDVAVYRAAQGTWYIRSSSNGAVSYTVFGVAEDVPTPADYDGDGKADIAVFRPSTGTWYRKDSSTGAFVAAQFGANGDRPTVGDFDGDGKADLGVFRPSTGAWYQTYSSNGFLFGEQFGISTDKIAAADYDGDGKTDIAIYRPSEGLWYVKRSSTSTYVPYVFGLAADIPTPGDFDGDGKADIGVFRPSDGTWYIVNSSNGSYTIYQFGAAGDKPVHNSFNN